LIGQLLRREIAGRYKGSFLGVFWTLLQPLLMLAVYTLVFGMVFEPRWVAVNPPAHEPHYPLPGAGSTAPGTCQPFCFGLIYIE
jgi:ABC-type polysaccharide/polyol phosphate export permease